MDSNYYKKYEPIFGEWRIVRLIGEGGYGSVFEIEREDFGTVYKAALKAITIPKTDSDKQTVLEECGSSESASLYFRSFVEEMVREFAIMSKLKGHSNIVSYEDHKVYRHVDGIGWDVLIRMELLTPLNKWLQGRKVTCQDIIRLGIDMCTALELCQKYKIIHRDIKPENIFVSDTGDYKLGDFGIARTAEKSTGASTRVGTVNYMAPEILRGERYDSRVDIYSLGIVMYRLLNNNRLPFMPPYPKEIAFTDREQANARRLKGEAMPAPARASGRLAEIVLKACAFDPADRYSSPTAMKDALKAIFDTETRHTNIYSSGGGEVRPHTERSKKRAGSNTYTETIAETETGRNKTKKSSRKVKAAAAGTKPKKKPAALFIAVGCAVALLLLLFCVLLSTPRKTSGSIKSSAVSFAAAVDKVAINEENFPNEVFRNYVSENFDTDGNGILSADERDAVEKIDVSGEVDNTGEIASLKGIEYFAKLKELSCGFNKITSLDVSNNTALESLHCQFNQLTSLDVSHNTALIELACGANKLTNLDVSKNTALEKLYCNYNQLTSLDVSHNTGLTELWCNSNQLKSLDVSKNTALEKLHCSSNQLESLDLWKNTKLEDLSCSNNQLTSLDISNNVLLSNFVYDDNLTIIEPFSVEITTENFPDDMFRDYISDNFDENHDGGLSSREINRVRDINISRAITLNDGTVDSEFMFNGYKINATFTSNDTPIRDLQGIQYFTELENLCCTGQSLTELNFISNTKLKNLACDRNKLTNLDISQNTALIELACGSNKLTNLDVSNNTALEYLSCLDNQLTSLDISQNMALIELYCGINRLTSLDVSKNTALTNLYCYYNQLTSLDVSHNIALEVLSCWSNQLTSLDVSNNTALEYLYCDHNQLTSLDVSNNTALIKLDCDDNQLTSLDISNNTLLTMLSCNENQLTSLDVSHNTALLVLGCSSNRLTSLDLSNNPKLNDSNLHTDNNVTIIR